MYFSTTEKHKGQSLDGETLDVRLLDERVKTWKNTLGLYHQENFPPKNFPINKMGEKFHDRSHILLQDYLGKTSEDFRQVYDEKSLPSIYEEVLTFFCAQITHKPEECLRQKVTQTALIKNFDFLKHIGYITEDSVYETTKNQIAKEMSLFMDSMISSSDFSLFHKTLTFSAKDCPNWDKTTG